MTGHLELGGIAVEVIRKDIKNVHLSVHPPSGAVRIAAPRRMSNDAIRLFAIAKIGWIKNQQRKLREQPREPAREYLDRESHYLWGKRYLLRIVHRDARPSVSLRHNTLTLQVRPGTTAADMHLIMQAWYRQQLKRVGSELIPKWEAIMRVTVNNLFIQRMKTKWGSSNPTRRNIRINTDLARMPIQCLEYVIVHEMSHFIERRHNHRFVELLNQYMPQWQSIRRQLNEAPLPHW